jgi:hypothetical protein
MSDPATPHRTRAFVRDRDAASQLVGDLTGRGIPSERVRTLDVDPTQVLANERDTGEADMAFTEATGKSLGAGWLIGALIGALAGAIGVSVLFEPPWASPLAAGITLAVAVGVAYIAGGLGFLQAGIARTGERGGQPLTEQRPGHRESDRGTSAEGAGVEVVVDAETEEEARTARTVFGEHRAELR